MSSIPNNRAASRSSASFCWDSTRGPSARGRGGSAAPRRVARAALARDRARDPNQRLERRRGALALRAGARRGARANGDLATARSARASAQPLALRAGARAGRRADRRRRGRNSPDRDLRPPGGAGGADRGRRWFASAAGGRRRVGVIVGKWGACRRRGRGGPGSRRFPTFGGARMAACGRRLRERAGGAGASRLRFDGLVDPWDLVSLGVSDLELLGRCPLQYLLRRRLRIEPLEEPESDPLLDPREIGILVHETLHQLYSADLASLLKGAEGPQLSAAVDAAMEPQLFKPRARRAPAPRGARRGHAEALAPGDPWLRDRGFARARRDGADRAARGAPVRGGARVCQRKHHPPGRFDRVVERRGERALVTDFKTGAREVGEYVKPADMRRGKTTQLALYALAHEARAGSLPDVEAARIHPDLDAKDRDPKKTLEAEKLTESRGVLESTLGTLLRLARAGRFPITLDEKMCTDHGVRRACRCSHAPTRERVGAAPEFAEYHALEAAGARPKKGRAMPKIERADPPMPTIASGRSSSASATWSSSPAPAPGRRACWWSGRSILCFGGTSSRGDSWRSPSPRRRPRRCGDGCAIRSRTSSRPRGRIPTIGRRRGLPPRARPRRGDRGRDAPRARPRRVRLDPHLGDHHDPRLCSGACGAIRSRPGFRSTRASTTAPSSRPSSTRNGGKRSARSIPTIRRRPSRSRPSTPTIFASGSRGSSTPRSPARRRTPRIATRRRARRSGRGWGLGRSPAGERGEDHAQERPEVRGVASWDGGSGRRDPRRRASQLSEVEPAAPRRGLEHDAPRRGDQVRQTGRAHARNLAFRRRCGGGARRRRAAAVRRGRAPQVPRGRLALLRRAPRPHAQPAARRSQHSARGGGGSKRSSSTSSRTPIPCNTRSCFSWRRRRAARPRAMRGASGSRRGDYSWWAIPSNRSTASAAPTSRRIGAPRRRFSRRGIRLALHANFRSPAELLAPLHRLFSDWLTPQNEEETAARAAPSYESMVAHRDGPKPKFGTSPRVEVWSPEASDDSQERGPRPAAAARPTGSPTRSIANYRARPATPRTRIPRGATIPRISRSSCAPSPTWRFMPARSSGAAFRICWKGAHVLRAVRGGRIVGLDPCCIGTQRCGGAAGGPALGRRRRPRRRARAVCRRFARAEERAGPLVRGCGRRFPTISGDRPHLRARARAPRARGVLPADDALRAILDRTRLRELHAAGFDGAQRIANLEKCQEIASRLAREDSLPIDGIAFELERRAKDSNDEGRARSRNRGSTRSRSSRSTPPRGSSSTSSSLPISRAPRESRARSELAFREPAGPAGLRGLVASAKRSGKRTTASALASLREAIHAAAEDRRILYVAATRARERLVLVASEPSHGPANSWISRIRGIFGADVGSEAGTISPERDVLLRIPQKLGTASLARRAEVDLIAAARSFEELAALARAGARPPIESPSGLREELEAEADDPGANPNYRTRDPNLRRPRAPSASRSTLSSRPPISPGAVRSRATRRSSPPRVAPRSPPAPRQ